MLYSNILFKTLIRIMLLGLIIYFQNGYTQSVLEPKESYTAIKTGAESFADYLPLIKEKSVAVVANQTSMIGNSHLIDTLISMEINIKKIFAPEHGFREMADAGKQIENSIDKKTGILIISLYGNNYKPSLEDLKEIDVIIFDIQDVGVRFYTYISTMHYIMEACAENNIKFIVLDRPNPNGFYIDGPVLDKKFKSFVGLHPVPLVHGLTIGEYAFMINNEGWLNNNIKCDLTVIKCKNYTHQSLYKLPQKPSPNLPNMRAVYLYPSLGLFEGTDISVGRGTDKPFQVVGHPSYKKFDFIFIPESKPGASEPLHKSRICHGFDLTKIAEQDLVVESEMMLNWILVFYQNTKNKKKFFNSFFDNLAGTDKLRHQIEEGLLEKEIRASWQDDINKYKVVRKKYLLYPDFE